MLPDRGLPRAVLIGTSEFARSDRLPALPAVRQNLTELLGALTDHDSGVLDTLSRSVLRWRLGLLATLAASSVVVGIAGGGLWEPFRGHEYVQQPGDHRGPCAVAGPVRSRL